MTKDNRVVVVGGDKMYGPFEDSGTARAWLDAPHKVDKPILIFSLWDTDKGNAETAHECGTRLETIAA